MAVALWTACSTWSTVIWGKVMGRPASKGLTAGKSRTYAFRAPNELLDRWEQFAADHGEEAQELLRQVMTQLVNKSRPEKTKPREEFSEPAALAATNTVDRAPKKAVKLLLTPSEHAALSAISDERECSIQFWIVSLVRASLTRGITVGGAELKALGDSNYQLMAIGRNLNQIAHQINADPARNLHRITSRMIENLSQKIEEHRKHVHALVNACTHRWKLKEVETPDGG